METERRHAQSESRVFANPCSVHTQTIAQDSYPQNTIHRMSSDYGFGVSNSFVLTWFLAPDDGTAICRFKRFRFPAIPITSDNELCFHS
jgi:hypothetical protein